MMNTFHISLTPCVCASILSLHFFFFLHFPGSYCTYTYLECPLSYCLIPLVHHFLSPPPSTTPSIFLFFSVSLSAPIITSYLYLLLFHSIIPSFLFTGPSLLSLPLFNSLLDANRLLQLSFSISPPNFLSFFFPSFFVLFSAHALAIPPSIRIYTTAGSGHEEDSGGDMCERRGWREERGEIRVTIRWSARMRGWIVNKRELLRLD